MKYLLLAFFLIGSITSWSQVFPEIDAPPTETKPVPKSDKILLSPLQEEVFKREFKNLPPFDKFMIPPKASLSEMYSIRNCFMYLDFDYEVVKQAQKRILVIAQRLYDDGYFVQLVSGKGSEDYCNKQNNMYDVVEKVVYIPIKHREIPEFGKMKNNFNALMVELSNSKK